MNLISFVSNKYSQTGEDGIIEEIFRRLEIPQGWFVEFGAWDGRYLSNCYNLVAHCGWSGVFIEGNPKKYEDLLLTKAAFPEKLHTLCAMVGFEGEGTLDVLLAPTPIPKDFELLSIDIDSYDWEVWNALEKYQPKVVIIECNFAVPRGVYSRHNPPVSIAASFTALLDLGERKGYQLVCATGNCFFVRNDLVPKLGLPQDELARPEKMFNRARHRKERMLELARAILPEAVLHKLFYWASLRRAATQKKSGF